MTTKRNRTALGAFFAVLFGVASYIFGIRWLMPRSGKWDGVVMLLSLVVSTAFFFHADILRRRLKEK